MRVDESDKLKNNFGRNYLYRFRFIETCRDRVQENILPHF